MGTSVLMQNDGTRTPGMHQLDDDAHEYVVWGAMMPSAGFVEVLEVVSQAPIGHSAGS
jgi:hypothetical protein